MITFVFNKRYLFKILFIQNKYNKVSDLQAHFEVGNNLLNVSAKDAP